MTEQVNTCTHLQSRFIFQFFFFFFFFVGTDDYTQEEQPGGKEQ